MAARTASGMWEASGAAKSRRPGQRGGVDHARHRRPRAGADVGRGAGDGPGRRQPAEHGRHDVGDALGDELDVRVVLVAAHPVRDDGREQRLDGAQQGDGERRGQQTEDQVWPERAASGTSAVRSGCRRSGCRSCLEREADQAGDERAEDQGQRWRLAHASAYRVTADDHRQRRRRPVAVAAGRQRREALGDQASPARGTRSAPRPSAGRRSP